MEKNKKDYKIRFLMRKYVGIKMLMRFLKDHGAYTAFLREVKKNEEPSSIINREFSGNFYNFLMAYGDRPEAILDKCLIWRLTEQGTDYWSHLHSVFGVKWDNFRLNGKK
jgi:hypothetical protein